MNHFLDTENEYIQDEYLDSGFEPLLVYCKKSKINKEQLLDETFHCFVTHLERAFLEGGTQNVNTDISFFSDKELDNILWEVEEEFGRMPSCGEIEDCFTDAINYIDDIYKIRSLQARDGGII